MKDTLETNNIGYTFVYVMLTIFTVVIVLSFILYSFTDIKNDLSVEWLIGYISLLGWYAGKKQWYRTGKHKPKVLPGEIFVGLCWTIYIILPFLHQFDLIAKKSALLTPYFIGVTTIYAGTVFLKYYQQGLKFLSDHES